MRGFLMDLLEQPYRRFKFNLGLNIHFWPVKGLSYGPRSPTRICSNSLLATFFKVDLPDFERSWKCHFPVLKIEKIESPQEVLKRGVWVPRSPKSVLRAA